MSYIENLFRNADVNDDNTLQKDELKLFLRMLFDGREPTEDELNEVRRESVVLYNKCMKYEFVCTYMRGGFTYKQSE